MGRLAAGPSTWTAFINQKQTTSAPFPRAPSSVESATVSIHENDSTPPCDCSQHNFNMSEGVPKNMRHPDGAYVRSSSWQKVTLLWPERHAPESLLHLLKMASSRVGCHFFFDGRIRFEPNFPMIYDSLG